MEIEVKRKVKKEVEEIVPMTLETYYVARVIRCGGYDNKTCIFEKEFNHKPDEQEIADVLVDYMTKKVFVTVNENYRLIEKVVQ